MCHQIKVLKKIIARVNTSRAVFVFIVDGISKDGIARGIQTDADEDCCKRAKVEGVERVPKEENTDEQSVYICSEEGEVH